MTQAQADIVVRSQQIPLDGMRLVLPNTAIAEVISYTTPNPVDGSPDWLLGSLEWRGLTIPLLAFETACSQKTVTINKKSRVVVLNALAEESSTPFYGLIAQGIPSLISLNESGIHNAPEIDAQAQDYVLCHCIIDGQQVTIPDQIALENDLKAIHLD